VASHSTSETLAALGAQLRALRLRENIDQQELASRAGVALNAVKNLESGSGATVTSLVKVARALGRAEWLTMLAPPVSISPLRALDKRPVPQRASKRRRA
jgi:transcriptional regulator with XRE-family HTH domain